MEDQSFSQRYLHQDCCFTYFNHICLKISKIEYTVSKEKNINLYLKFWQIDIKYDMPYENCFRILAEFKCVLIWEFFVQILFKNLYEKSPNKQISMNFTRICMKITRIWIIFVQIFKQNLDDTLKKILIKDA